MTLLLIVELLLLLLVLALGRLELVLLRGFGEVLLRLDALEDVLGGPTESWEDPDKTVTLLTGGVPGRDLHRQSKPTLLYITVITPDNGGSGVAIRAGMVLRILAERYRVWLLVAPLFTPAIPFSGPLADLCEEWAVLDVDRSGWETLLYPWQSSLDPFGDVQPPFLDRCFDVVHFYRLYALPVARRYFLTADRRHLDLDDIESKTYRRLEHLHHMRSWQEANSAGQAEEFARLETEVFQQVDRVYVCSEEDRIEIAERTDIDVCVLPNVVETPAALPHREEKTFRFLFIGSLNYYPNQDALEYFCAEVLPVVRRRTTRAFTLSIVGTGGKTLATELAGVPEVRMVGSVPDVAPCYATADAAVVPLRAGGGTRVKVLEAFSYHCPVVSTPLGVEGLGVRDGVEVMVGDTAEDFADACVRLMTDPVLRRRLAENAWVLQQRSYTPAAMARAYDACDGA